MTNPPVAYNYDPHDGRYIGCENVVASPLDPPGVWLIPAHSTLIEPPAASPNQIAVFRDGEWSLLADHMGETWFDQFGRPFAVMGIGDPSEARLKPRRPSRLSICVAFVANLWRAVRVRH